MPARIVRITSHNGAHARPVAEIVRLTMATGAPVTLSAPDGSRVDLSSVLAVMDLALVEGSEVRLETPDSPDAERLLADIAAVLDPRG